MKFLKNIFTSEKSPSAAQDSKSKLRTTRTEQRGNEEKTGKESVDALPFGQDLIELANHQNEARTLAFKRIASLAEQEAKLKIELKRLIPEANTLLAIASYQSNTIWLNELVASLNEKQIYAAAIDTQSPPARRALVSKLHDLDLLKSAAQHFKTRDKNTYKTAKNKISQIREAEQARDHINQQLDQTIRELKDHSVRPFSVDYRLQFDTLVRRKERLEEYADTTWKSECESYIHQAQDKINQAQLQLEQEEQKRETAEAPQNDTEKHTEVENIQPEISGPNPEEFESKPQQEQGQAKKARKEAEQKQNQQIKDIFNSLRRGRTAVEQGQLTRAQGIRFSIAKDIEKLESVPSNLEKHWAEYQESTEKLADWQSYAIAPKLKELNEKMQRLCDQPLEASRQSEAIKNLQDQWKSITKGSAGAHQESWEHFKQNADKAYEVCKRHFEEQEKLRIENEGKRQALISQLQDYLHQYDWANAVWKDVETVLRSARDEWKRYSPSPQASYKSLQQSFSQQLDGIQEKLNQEYDKNKSEKERLINSIEPLIESKDLQHAIDTAIKFQTQWKTIGRCRHKDDERLWKLFRSHCDAIFTRRDTQRAEARSQTDALIKQAESCIDSLNSILEAEDPKFLEGIKSIDDLKADFDGIEGLPEKVELSLSKKLDKLRSKIESRQQLISQKKQEGSLTRAFEIKRKLNAALSADSQAGIDDTLTTIKDLPNDFRKVLSGLIKEYKTGTEQEDTDQRYRKFCIGVEIDRGIESPAEDKTLRMEYQIQKLQNGLGAIKTSKQEHAISWLALPFIETTMFEQYEKRFLEVWAGL